MEKVINNGVFFSLEKVQGLFYELYEEIKHGDDEHQGWLKEKIEDFMVRNLTNYSNPLRSGQDQKSQGI